MSTKLKSRLTDKLPATKTPDSDQEEQEVKSPKSSVSKEEERNKSSIYVSFESEKS